MSDITRYRGDTRRIRRTVTADGAAVNITDWSFVLTINREYNPVNANEQGAQIVGVIADAAAGVVDFIPTLDDVADIGDYYYDIEATDAGGSVSTLDKGAFTLLQDVTKALSILWLCDDEQLAFDPFPLDGSDGCVHMLFVVFRTRCTTHWVHASMHGMSILWMYVMVCSI
jgi:hypothetical protein